MLQDSRHALCAAAHRCWLHRCTAPPPPPGQRPGALSSRGRRLMRTQHHPLRPSAGCSSGSSSSRVAAGTGTSLRQIGSNTGGATKYATKYATALAHPPGLQLHNTHLNVYLPCFLTNLAWMGSGSTKPAAEGQHRGEQGSAASLLFWQAPVWRTGTGRSCQQTHSAASLSLTLRCSGPQLLSLSIKIYHHPPRLLAVLVVGGHRSVSGTRMVVSETRWLRLAAGQRASLAPQQQQSSRWTPSPDSDSLCGQLLWQEHVQLGTIILHHQLLPQGTHGALWQGSARLDHQKLGRDQKDHEGCLAPK